MNNNMEKTLIHPIDKTAYKETIHQDFVSREEFINQSLYKTMKINIQHVFRKYRCMVFSNMRLWMKK